MTLWTLSRDFSVPEISSLNYRHYNSLD